MKTTTYDVGDIHCGSCERLITTMVQEVERVSEVVADHNSNQVKVTFDEERVEEPTIIEALANTGFQPL